MAFTFLNPPQTDRDALRIAIADTKSGDGPAPDMANLDDSLLDHWLSVGGDVNGAAALAFDHLAALWISRPIFGPGELSTVHTNLADKYMKLAKEYRARSSDPDVSAAVVRVGGFAKVDGFSGQSEGEY